MKNPKFTLKAYAVFSSAFLNTSKLESQVVITNFDPNLRIVKWDVPTVNYDTVKIDIDSNGIFDLIFDYQFEGDYAIVGVEIDDMVIGIGAEENYDIWAYNVYAFNSGEIVDENIHWKDDGQNIASASISAVGSSIGYFNVYYFGNFDSNGRYLPLKLNIEDSLHYGWVRLSIGPLGNKFHWDEWHTVDYSLVVYDIGYEQQPNTGISCQTNVPKENFDPVLLHSTDGDDFSEFVYRYTSASITDYSELRIYIVDNYSDAKYFSVNDALNLSPDNYSVISGDTIEPYTAIYAHFDETTKTINGESFSLDKYYSAFYMKIPLDEDTSHVTLSTPCPLIKAIKQACNLNVEAEIIKVNNTGTAADFTVNFIGDEDENDIQSYRIGLINSETDNYDINNLFLDGYSIEIPKTGAEMYTANLAGINYDAEGNLISDDKYYTPIIAANGDGYYFDLPCYEVGVDSAKTSNSDFLNSNAIEFIYFQNKLSININNNISIHELQFQLTSISGKSLLASPISNYNSIHDLQSYHPGLYFACIYRNGTLLALKKISIL